MEHHAKNRTLLIGGLAVLLGACGSYVVPVPSDAGPTPTPTPTPEDGGVVALCGDGMLDPGEACDEGEANLGHYGGCNPDCTFAAYCGDGRVDPTEDCDEGESGNDGVYGGCNPDCSLAPRCGDGATDPGEACDEGAANDDLRASCSGSCQPTGLLVRLDAADVFGTGVIPSDGFVVDAWSNQVGAPGASQRDAAARPRYRAQGIDGRPALEFDGNDDRLIVPVDIDATTRPEITVAVVFQNAPGDPAPYAGLWGQDDGSWDRFLSTGGTAGISNGAGFTPVAGITAEGRPILAVTTLRDGGASTVHVNGEPAASFTERHTNTGDRQLSIGSLNGPSIGAHGHSFDGLIAEVYVYERALSDAERADLEDMLLARYRPSPAGLVHEWTFDDGTARDSVGGAHGTLRNGARVVDGALELDGVDDYMQSSPIGGPIAERTLVAWVRAANLEQRGGGVLVMERSAGTDVFDGIVYGEFTGQQWTAGSDFAARSLVPDNGGALETSTGWRMVAIAYDASNGVTIYRDDALYARRYVQGELVEYAAGASDVLVGLRHEDHSRAFGSATGGDAFFAGAVDRAMVFDRALSAAEIAALFDAGP